MTHIPQATSDRFQELMESSKIKTANALRKYKITWLIIGLLFCASVIFYLLYHSSSSTAWHERFVFLSGSSGTLSLVLAFITARQMERHIKQYRVLRIDKGSEPSIYQVEYQTYVGRRWFELSGFDHPTHEAAMEEIASFTAKTTISVVQTVPERN